MTPSYNGKLLGQEKERIFDTCSNVDESHMRLFTERSQTQATSCAPFGRMFCCYCSVAKLCPILCDSRDCSLSGSPVLGISQARILEWVAISFSGGVFPTQGSNLRLLCLLNQQADSLPLSPLGSPLGCYRKGKNIETESRSVSTRV